MSLTNYADMKLEFPLVGQCIQGRLEPAVSDPGGAASWQYTRQSQRCSICVEGDTQPHVTWQLRVHSCWAEEVVWADEQTVGSQQTETCMTLFNFCFI